MIHRRLDLQHWFGVFPLDQANADVRCTSASSPAAIAYVEQIRARTPAAELKDPVPIDLCVWALGEAPRRDVTKVGGLPYWPADAPWPTSGDGRPYTFVGQLSFADSLDILPRLPAEILCVFALEDDCQDIRAHWVVRRERDLLPAEQIPQPAWQIRPCHAHLHRTVEYRDAGPSLDGWPYPLSRWARHMANATKLGGIWESSGELPEEESIADETLRMHIAAAREHEGWQRQNFLAQLGSVSPHGRWPFVNVEALEYDPWHDSDRFLSIMDMGELSFFHDERGTFVDSCSS